MNLAFINQGVSGRFVMRFLLTFLMILTSTVAEAVMITVDSDEQEVPFANDGDCTLGEAITAANTDSAVDNCLAGSGNDTIYLPTGTYSLTQPATSSYGLPVITSQMIIAGQGLSLLDTIIQRDPGASTNFGIFQISSTGNLTLINLRITGATGQPAVGNSGTLSLTTAELYANQAGGIVNQSSGTIELTDCFITNNSRSTTPNQGGGIRNLGTMTVTNCDIYGNTAGYGGGIYSNSNSSTTIDDSLIANNIAIEGGGIYFYENTSSYSTLTINNTLISNNHAVTSSPVFVPKGGGLRVAYPSSSPSVGSVSAQDTTFVGNWSTHHGGAVYGVGGFTRVTFKSNSANGGNGGGIYALGTSSYYIQIALINSTFYDNEATGSGGALYQQEGRTSIIDSTIAGNSATLQGGGIVRSPTANRDVELTNSILDTNMAPTGPDCSGTITSYAGGNLIGSTTGCTVNTSAIATGDAFDVSAGLLPYVDSTTPGRGVIPISADSLARDTGVSCFPPNDQRLVARFGVCDKGAYEYACGDENVQEGEQCDDGNGIDDDACSNACVAASCGDGVLQTAVGETCDDGNTATNDGCNATCQSEVCGDGIIQSPLGEQCDDGNMLNDDGCSATCALETVCGDGLVEGVEQCDDGNTINEDGCNSICVIESCGDSIVQPGLGEQCDDGNTANFDSCSNACMLAACGDGIPNYSPASGPSGEQCDDGNTINGDGCSATCTLENVCGDGILATWEQCDDGNTINGDGCSSICALEPSLSPTDDDEEEETDEDEDTGDPADDVEEPDASDEDAAIDDPVEDESEIVPVAEDDGEEPEVIPPDVGDGTPDDPVEDEPEIIPVEEDDGEGPEVIPPDVGDGTPIDDDDGDESEGDLPDDGIEDDEDGGEASPPVDDDTPSRSGSAGGGCSLSSSRNNAGETTSSWMTALVLVLLSFIRRASLFRTLALFFGLILISIPTTWAETFTVTNTNDSGTGSLRETIENANSSGGSDTIAFDSSVTGTIELTSALPTITEGLTITGPGSSTLTIDANGAGGVLSFNSSTNDQSFTISGLTMTGGNNTAAGGGISISSGDSLTINSCKIIANTSSAGGGGISHVGNLLVINDSTISQNHATGGFHGGGIFSSGTLLSLSNSTVSQNEADSFGGGLYLFNPGEAMIIESAITDNSALHGGGIAFNFSSSATLSLINSTISGNMADDHGGGTYLGALFSGTTVNFSNVTLANNTADDNADGTGDGGGLYSASSSVTLNTKNTLLGNNIDKGTEANDCSATLTSLGYNLIENTAECTIDGDTTGNLTGSDPLLNALADNGGSTQTHALQPLSPAVDAGNPAGCTDHAGGPLTMDQRGSGFVRHIDGNLDGTPRCDIGAFELTVCSDGILSGDEACDDGNTDINDGCNATCQSEVCGDTIIQSPLGEQCDDGNTTSGDGCSNVCAIESAEEEEEETEDDPVEDEPEIVPVAEDDGEEPEVIPPDVGDGTPIDDDDGDESEGDLPDDGIDDEDGGDPSPPEEDMPGSSGSAGGGCSLSSSWNNAGETTSSWMTALVLVFLFSIQRAASFRP